MLKETVSLVKCIKGRISVDTSVSLTADDDDLIVILSTALTGKLYQYSARVTSEQLQHYWLEEFLVVKAICNKFEDIIRERDIEEENWDGSIRKNKGITGFS